MFLNRRLKPLPKSHRTSPKPSSPIVVHSCPFLRNRPTKIRHCIGGAGSTLTMACGSMSVPPLPSADAPASVAQRANYQKKKKRKMNRKMAPSRRGVRGNDGAGSGEDTKHKNFGSMFTAESLTPLATSVWTSAAIREEARSKGRPRAIQETPSQQHGAGWHLQYGRRS